MTTDNSQQGPKELGRLSADHRSFLHVVPIRRSPLDPGLDVAAEASEGAGEHEAILFRPRLRFADENTRR